MFICNYPNKLFTEFNAQNPQISQQQNLNFLTLRIVYKKTGRYQTFRYLYNYVIRCSLILITLTGPSVDDKSLHLSITSHSVYQIPIKPLID